MSIRKTGSSEDTAVTGIEQAGTDSNGNLVKEGAPVWVRDDEEGLAQENQAADAQE